MKNYTPTHPQEIVDEILKLSEEGLSIRKIADSIFDTLDYKISKSSVADIMKAKKSGKLIIDKQKELNDNMKEVTISEPPKNETLFGIIEVKDGTYNYEFHERTATYIGKVNDEMIMMPQAKVARIFEKYSRTSAIKGYPALGKSRQEVMYEEDLSSNEWSFLQNNLFLRTTGPNADPITIMQAEQEGTLQDLAERKAKEQLMHKYQHQVIKEQKKLYERNAIKALKIVNNFEARKNYVYEEGGFDFDFSDKVEIQKFKKGDVGMYNISDLHTGGRDLEETKELLRNIAQDIIDSGYKKVILNINGDMFESAIAGGYHRGQIEDMAMHQGTDNPIFGNKLIEFTAFALENCLIRPVHEAGIQLLCHGRAGNHGRGTVNSEDDKAGLLELAMYFAIQQGLKDTNVLFEYSESLQPVYYIDNFLGFNKVAIALSHGHIKTHKAKRKSIASKYLHKADYVFVIQSHYHNGSSRHESKTVEQNFTETGDRCMLIVTPALCPANKYATEQVIGDSPRGFVKIENNRFNRFKVLFEYV